MQILCRLFYKCYAGYFVQALQEFYECSAGSFAKKLKVNLQVLCNIFTIAQQDILLVLLR